MHPGALSPHFLQLGKVDQERLFRYIESEAGEASVCCMKRDGVFTGRHK